MTRLRYAFLASMAVLCCALTACNLGAKQNPAPIVNAGFSQGGNNASTSTGAEPVKVTAKEAVYYTVQAGDSLRKIGLQFGQSWKDIAQWNNLEDANQLKVGQVLLVVPASAGAENASNTTTAEDAQAVPIGSGAIVPAPTKGVESRMQWTWPAKGSVIANYDGNNKGIDIGGNVGDPIYAAADGRVAYVGNGLRGYGNLVIIKHNDVFVTAYAHNQKILVQENQAVRKGEKIAEMGNSDADKVMLHFEVRQQSQEGGGAVNPLKYLPPR